MHHKHHHFHEDEHFPLHGITYNRIVTNRNEKVTFSLAESYTADVSISWEIHDLWLGSDKKSLYVPNLKTTGSLAHPPATFSEYFPRLITGSGPEITTNLFFWGPIEIKCFLKKSNETECLTLTYHPRLSEHNEIKTENLLIDWKNVKCAPIFSTQKFFARYKGPGEDRIVCSQLVLEENGNKTGKVIFAEEDDPIICEHTWNTAGEKFLTYTVWYDNGFRTVSKTISKSYEIDKEDINSKDDFIVSTPDRPGPPPMFPGNPPKVYVICTKRCWTDCANVNGIYDADVIDKTGSDYDYS